MVLTVQRTASYRRHSSARTSTGFRFAPARTIGSEAPQHWRAVAGADLRRDREHADLNWGRLRASWSCRSGALRRSAGAAQRERVRFFAPHHNVPKHGRCCRSGARSHMRFRSALVGLILATISPYLPVGPQVRTRITRRPQLSEFESARSRWGARHCAADAGYP